MDNGCVMNIRSFSYQRHPGHERPNTVLGPLPYDQWPLWAKALKQFATKEDKGIGDVVARIIGEEKSEAFKAWHIATFGRPCNCNARRVRWNFTYPLNNEHPPDRQVDAEH